MNTAGRTQGTRYYVEPALLRALNFSAATTLKRIKPHRLAALVLEDLQRYPASAISAIHQRLGGEIHPKQIKRALDELLARGVNDWFFSTVQLVMAGNDSEGLRYGTVGTPEKYFLTWKEDEADNAGFKLDKYLAKLCSKERLLELMRDFVLFDGGVKKLPRVHQYFGIKAAQRHVRDKRGGIIWHTQGAGKAS